jgi:hypothetical protein
MYYHSELNSMPFHLQAKQEDENNLVPAVNSLDMIHEGNKHITHMMLYVTVK